MHLELRDVAKGFGATGVFSGVSFTASAGIVGLVGVNGAGKTTLLRIISGGLRPDRGTVSIEFDSDGLVSAGGFLRRKTALMPQSIIPPRGMTVLDFMTYMAWLRAVPRGVAAARIDTILESVGLSDVKNKRMTEISGGMLRRATFAQALVSQPEILLLDEPTTGVDPEQRLAMRHLIAAQSGERLILMSSHVMEDIATVASRVLMLDSGALVFDGSIEQLWATGAALVAANSGLSPLEAAFMHIRKWRGSSMTGRLPLLRIDLLLPSYVLLAMLALWVGGAHWLGEWQWTFDNINGVTVLLGPYAGAVAAWRVAQDEENAVLYAATSRGWAVPLRAGVSVWCTAVIAWAMTAASAIIGTALVVHGGPTPVWVLAAGPMVLAASVAVGTVVAHRWPSRIVAILVAPTLFMLGGLGASGALPNLLRQGPGTSSLAGLRWNPVTFLLQMAALLLLATACVLASGLRRETTSGRDLVLPVGAAAVFVAVVVILQGTNLQRFILSSEQPSLCSSGSPAVCVAPSNARALSSLSHLVYAYIPAAKRIGLDLPSSFREVLPNHGGGAAWGTINLGSSANDPSASVQTVLTALATPGDCRVYYDVATPPSPEIYQAQNILATMIARVHAGNLADLQHHGFLSWARLIYHDLRACDLGAIRLPDGER